MSEEKSEITALLHRLSAGDQAAERDLIPRVYSELRALASRYSRAERPDHTLQTTALVNEAYLRLVGNEGIVWRDRNHFFAIAATVMRRILVDHARARRAEKRGAQFTFVGLDELQVAGAEPDNLILALEEALQHLEQLDPRQTKVVVMRYYGGLTEEEIADVLGVSARTVKRDWLQARTWLHAELSRR